MFVIQNEKLTLLISPEIKTKLQNIYSFQIFSEDKQLLIKFD